MKFAGAVILATVLVGCNKAHAQISEGSRTISLPTMSSPFLGFIALDYTKPGHHPFLTEAEGAAIQDALVKVKPCQRPLLRYVVSNDEVSLFFAVGQHEGAHVFGTRSVYDPSDAVGGPLSDDHNADMMVKQGIKWDIDHEPCHTPHTS
jgi:hypothetical protein